MAASLDLPPLAKSKRTQIVSFSKIKEDPSGPQLSKAGAREAMREAKRVDRVTPNMTLNGALMDLYHEDLFGGAPGQPRSGRG